jgi:two-component system, chemotaxis family, chemotaxis protein CheY
MKKVLIVDDSSTMRRMVIASLKQITDVTFGEASNGLEAIERLAISPIDLMILDLNMPDIHGLEVLKFVRNHQDYQNIPVIVLTTKGDQASRNDVLAGGATSYLTKPFEPQTLAIEANKLLRK